jgi:para-aminobenzoate synthetase/4-amino-4-deoxychorismate lyase
VSAPDFQLLETMRWEPEAGFPFARAHLVRLSASAAFFGFRYDEAAVREALREATDGLPFPEPARVRLTLAADGTPTVGVTPLAPPVRSLRVGLYPEPVEAGGPFWRHKTTHRLHYEGPYAWAQARGLDDALLVSARGEVIEATRASVWLDHDGGLLTPPLTAGGLPGVYRAHMLANVPRTGEAVLTTGDVRRVSEVLLSNAVQGLVRAEVVDG